MEVQRKSRPRPDLASSPSPPGVGPASTAQQTSYVQISFQKWLPGSLTCDRNGTFLQISFSFNLLLVPSLTPHFLAHPASWSEILRLFTLNYIQNLTSSHHPFHRHPDLVPHHLSPVILQRPPNPSPCFRPCHPSVPLNRVTRTKVSSRVTAVLLDALSSQIKS